MGSNLYFKSFGNEPSADGSGSRPSANDQLARQPSENDQLAKQLSIYSLTFDEFQSTTGSLGKDYGSINMDDLLKNIWSADENQSIDTPSGTGTGHDTTGDAPQQKQGSLTLPSTLSQNTVDEVWKKEESDSVGSNMPQPQRQQTLGEMTLEEFLFKAGIVKEDAQLNVKPPSAGSVFGGMFLNESSRSSNPKSNGLVLGFQQTGMDTSLMGSQKHDQILIQAARLPLNVNGNRSNQPQLTQQQHQHQIFPKTPAGTYESQLPFPTSNQLVGAGLKGGFMGTTTDHGLSNNGLLGQSGGMGMLGLGSGAVTVATRSPANLSPDGIKSNGDTFSVSPGPYVFNGGFRERKRSSAVDKVVERRQRRMIKNRESAARSRARKQAYTLELEAEVHKLKEENQDLQKKQSEIMEIQKTQAEIMKIQKTQVTEMKRQGGTKKQCIRRTLTGPW